PPLPAAPPPPTGPNGVWGQGGSDWNGASASGSDLSLGARFVDPDGADGLLGGDEGAARRFRPCVAHAPPPPPAPRAPQPPPPSIPPPRPPSSTGAPARRARPRRPAGSRCPTPGAA